MKKGKYGVAHGVVAAAALAFAILKMPTLVALVLAYALLAEKDEWLNRQTLYAFILSVSYYLIDLVISGGFGALTRVIGWFRFYRLLEFASGAQVVLQTALYILLIAACVLALVRVVKGKDAGIPLVSKLVDLATGTPTPPKPKPAPQPTPAPVPQPMPAPVPQPVPAPIPQPVPAPIPQPVPAPHPASVPQPVSATPIAVMPGWQCGCGTHNDGNFCVSCGQKRPL